jgi:patatin-like phospholipase/acyl hydrolase
MVGTSAGGIVAGALAVGLSPDETTHLWEKEVVKIFTQGYKHRMGTLDNAIGSAYSTTELEKMLSQMIGDKTLKELKPKFLSPSFRLEPTGKLHNPRWHPVYFNNFPQSGKLSSLR